jgi:hypothetical protein
LTPSGAFLAPRQGPPASAHTSPLQPAKLIAATADGVAAVTRMAAAMTLADSFHDE